MILLMNDWYWGRDKIGDYVVVFSYIYANKKDGYKATPIFMLVEHIEAPAMWEQMCFKPDRIKSK